MYGWCTAEETIVIQIMPPEKLPGEEKGTQVIERSNPGGSVKGKHHHSTPHGVEAVVVRIETHRDPAFETDGHSSRHCALHAKNRLSVVLLRIVGREAHDLRAWIDEINHRAHRPWWA